jgi:uncharacterized protein YkwD
MTKLNKIIASFAVSTIVISSAISNINASAIRIMSLPGQTQTSSSQSTSSSSQVQSKGYQWTVVSRYQPNSGSNLSPIPKPNLVDPVTPTTPVVVTPPPATNPPAPVTPTINNYFATNCVSGFESQMLTLVNNYRAQNNKPALTLDSNLSGVACAHTNWMSINDTLAHIGYQGANPFERCARAISGFTCNGENVGYNTDSTAQNFFDNYKASAPHNANMLSSSFTKVGFAKSGIYNTQLFKN